MLAVITKRTSGRDCWDTEGRGFRGCSQRRWDHFSKTDTGLQHVYPLIFPLPTPDDFRIFCGDLGNEVNDDILARAFSRFPSFLKAKVIRDKRTGKTKGYGFVSFKDPSDYVRAMREMNGECGLP